MNPDVFSLSNPTRETLVKADPDRIRSAAFANSTLKAQLELFYAFHYELAKVPEFVSEPLIGQIRYQWWRDAVAEIYEDRPVRAHEISTPLTTLFKAVQMPRFWVDRLIDGRERDLDPTPFETLDAALEYCRETSGLLLQMAVHICRVTEGGSALDETSLARAGEAWGLTGLARSWKFYHPSMLSLLKFDAVCDAVHAHYTEAKQGLGSIPAASLPALSYIGLIPKYIKRMTSSGHDPLQHMPSYAPPLKQIRLLQVTLSGKI